MAVPNQIKIAELDYDQILQNLIAFMKTDPAFADYDFAGSGLRLLSRVLAYVIFYQNYYLTAAVNESFLDTAQLRSSVVAHAKMLGYDAHGTQGARCEANVAVQMTDTTATTLALPALTQFTLAANSNLSFYNLVDVELSQNTDTLLYEASGVELVEGTPLDYRFTVDVTNPTQRFVIPNANVDYSTIRVNVQVSQDNSEATTFVRASNYITVAANDPVFFVQEAYDGYPEITFGNGVIGRPVEHGNIVIVSFLISHGEDGNNVRGPFNVIPTSLTGFVTGNTGASDANTVASMGGAPPENLDDVRYMAPSVYQTQNRCVTADDYKTVILQAYGERIAAINVFGGEQGDPNDPANRPLYGRVFIVLKPTIGLRFTDITRKQIENTLLGPRMIVGVIPQVIDPDYTYLNVTTSVKYDPRLTTRTRPQLQTAITDNILTYAQNSLEKFDTAFYYSKFTGVIDNSDPAIVSSLTRVDLEKRIYPKPDIANHFVIKFGCPLRVPVRTPLAGGAIYVGTAVVANQSSILQATSHRFTYTNDLGVTRDNCFFYEWEAVVHIAYRATNGAVVIHQTTVGTLDTDTGLLTLDNFVPRAIEGGAVDIRIRVIPTTNDFTPHLNQLFTLDNEGVAVQTLNVTTATLDDQTAFFSGGIVP